MSKQIYTMQQHHYTRLTTIAMLLAFAGTLFFCADRYYDAHSASRHGNGKPVTETSNYAIHPLATGHPLQLFVLCIQPGE